MPEAPATFLCDEMLGALARWLRAAGHDAALAAPGAPDADLIRQAMEAGRLLVSRDRRLVEAASRRAAALHLTGDDLDQHARRLRDELGVDWTLAPFTRCMVDNTPLGAATEADLAKIPEMSRGLPGPFRACPACGRVFWPGSHVKRMLGRLQAWRDGEAESKAEARP
jgi:uncharacterized protein with PIN domain